MSSRAARLEESGEEWNGDEGTGENGVKMFPGTKLPGLDVGDGWKSFLKEHAS